MSEGLCFRCEHRVRFFEAGDRPRFECGDPECNKWMCYMYKPVRPVVLAKQENDERPQFGPAMLSARSAFVRVAEAELNLKQYEDGNALYWDLEDEFTED